MAEFKNLDGITDDQINFELRSGGRFVVFQYCISIILLTFKRTSGIYFVKAGESTTRYGLPFTLVTCIFGWWGLPWGPVYSIGSLKTNLKGGVDVTREVLNSMNRP